MTSRQPTRAKNTSQATPFPSASAIGEQLLDVAVEAADAAARVIRERTATAGTLTWEVKDRADFVSVVDTASERAIREVIERRLPDAVLIGEELSPDAVARGTTFVADPLDGTTNFLHGYPVYAVSIAATHEGELEAAVIVDVTRDDRYTAVRGGGAWRNSQRLAVSTLTDPSRALIGTGFPFKHLEMLDVYQRQLAAVIRGTAGVRRAGAAALDLADVAGGRFDAFWELMLAPWDVAAGILLVREAGGIVTDVEGRPATGLTHTGIVAGSPVMHDWLMTRLRESSPRSTER